MLMYLFSIISSFSLLLQCGHWFKTTVTPIQTAPCLHPKMLFYCQAESEMHALLFITTRLTTHKAAGESTTQRLHPPESWQSQPLDPAVSGSAEQCCRLFYSYPVPVPNAFMVASTITAVKLGCIVSTM